LEGLHVSPALLASAGGGNGDNATQAAPIGCLPVRLVGWLRPVVGWWAAANWFPTSTAMVGAAATQPGWRGFSFSCSASGWDGVLLCCCCCCPAASHCLPAFPPPLPPTTARRHALSVVHAQALLRGLRVRCLGLWVGHLLGRFYNLACPALLKHVLPRGI